MHRTASRQTPTTAQCQLRAECSLQWLDADTRSPTFAANKVRQPKDAMESKIYTTYLRFGQTLFPARLHFEHHTATGYSNGEHNAVKFCVLRPTRISRRGLL